MAKFYWLRLQKDFFKRHDIMIIEDMPNGKDYILFYLKMLVESVSHEGELRFSDTIPYNVDMLATITHTNTDIVRAAMKVFTELGMIEVLDDDTIYMAEVTKMIGSAERDDYQRESDRERQRRCRAKKKEALLSRDNNVTCHGEIEIEKEIELEIELESDKARDALSRIMDHWNEMLSPYGITEVKSINDGTTRYKLLKARLKQYGEEEIVKAIDNVALSGFLQGKNNRGWMITFDWFIKPDNFSKVLDGNYIDKDAPKKGVGGIDWSRYADE